MHESASYCYGLMSLASTPAQNAGPHRGPLCIADPRLWLVPGWDLALEPPIGSLDSRMPNDCANSHFVPNAAQHIITRIGALDMTSAHHTWSSPAVRCTSPPPPPLLPMPSPPLRLCTCAYLRRRPKPQVNKFLPN
jgi:hypothetical protein